MNVYIVERVDNVSWCEDYAMVVVAQDKKHAERKARWTSDHFKKAQLKVKGVSLNVESVLLIANTGA